MNKFIDDDKYELYDRNIRLWGKENQVKLSNSNVLLINLTTTITELAKNLLLAGINIYLYDQEENQTDRIVTEDDIESNYFINSANIGMKRVNVLKECLQNINLYASVKVLENFEKLDDINCVCLGFRNFKILESYESLFRHKNIPFYALNCSGMFGFFYNNLEDHQNASNTEINGSFNKIQSLCLKKIIENYFDTLNKNFNKKRIIRNSLFISICLLHLYEKEFNNESILEEKLTFSETILKQKNLDFLSASQEFKSVLKKLIDDFNKEFNPVCSVIGGIVSQEVQKILTNEVVFPCLYAYNAEEQSGNFIDLKK